MNGLLYCCILHYADGIQENISMHCNGEKQQLWGILKIVINSNINHIQAFLDFHSFDFCNFRFTAVYNSILFSSPLVLLSNLDYVVFASAVFYLCPHINSVNWGMPVLSFGVLPQQNLFLINKVHYDYICQLGRLIMGHYGIIEWRASTISILDK